MKGLSGKVRNHFIRSAEERLEARLAMEATEKAEREAVEKVAKKDAEKESAEADAKEKVEQEAEAAMIAKATQKAAFMKVTKVALTQGDSSTTDLAPLVIITLEEL